MTTTTATDAVCMRQNCGLPRSQHYNDGTNALYCENPTRWKPSAPAPTFMAPTNTVERMCLEARLKALSEVHDAYHFDGYTTEEQFDLYLHEKITEVRHQLGFGVVAGTTTLPATQGGT